MSVPYKTVLISIDLEDKNMARLDRSYPNLAHLASKVILLSVLENYTFGSEEERETFLDDRNKQLSAIANSIQNKTGLEVEPVIKIGKPAKEILKAADSYDVDLIAMSTHTHIDEKYTKKNAIGSTTNHVVRESKVPVFTFNSNVHLNKIEKILLPLDLTVATKQKVTHAIQLAKSIHASIAIVSVLDSLKFADIDIELDQQLAQVKEFIEEANIPCSAELIESKSGAKSVAHAILNYSERVEADLIMIMTQQENKLVEFFMGSSAQTMIRLSEIPVMSIIPKDLGFIVGV
ncbi:MAG: universal stress protein [Bacteroidetes bacterium]|nr:universal stress protein [Bacteroidota bacterium]